MRKILGLFGLFSILMFLPVSLRSQEREDSLCIYFQVNKFEIDTSFNDNGSRMNAFAEKIKWGGVSNCEKLHFVINASASPEGGERPNEALALLRAESLADWLMSEFGVGRESVEIGFAGVGWDELRDLVLKSGMEYSSEVADIIENVPVFIFKGKEIVDSRRKRLMDLGMGNPYRYMLEHIFPLVRNSKASVRCISVADTTATVDTTATSDTTVADSESENHDEAPVEAPTETPVENPAQTPAEPR